MPYSGHLSIADMPYSGHLSIADMPYSGHLSIADMPYSGHLSIAGMPYSGHNFGTNSKKTLQINIHRTLLLGLDDVRYIEVLLSLYI